jgi:large subunit ribosomal protein L32
MAVPKKRTSVSRKGKRRAGQHHKLYANPAISDPNTGELALPHRITPSGFFKGVKVFETREDKVEEESTTEA